MVNQSQEIINGNYSAILATLQITSYVDSKILLKLFAGSWAKLSRTKI